METGNVLTVQAFDDSILMVSVRSKSKRISRTVSFFNRSRAKYLENWYVNYYRKIVLWRRKFVAGYLINCQAHLEISKKGLLFCDLHGILETVFHFVLDGKLTYRKAHQTLSYFFDWFYLLHFVTGNAGSEIDWNTSLSDDLANRFQHWISNPSFLALCRFFFC